MTDLESVHDSMDRWIDAFLAGRRGDGAGAAPSRVLPIDVAETETGYRIEAPLPGFRPEDVEVTYADGILTVEARHSERSEDRKGSYLRREIVQGAFRRQVSLPGEVRADEIKASYRDGILTLEVPRETPPQPKRIAVTAAPHEKR